MATPILRYSPGGPAVAEPRVVTPSVTTFTTETEDDTNPANPTPILDYTPSGGAPVPPWPPAPEDLTYPECGITQLIDGQSWIDVEFVYEKPDANWIFEELQIVNTTDPTSLNIWPGIVTVKTVTGFTIQLNGLPDTDNYFLHWAVGGCATSDWVVSSGVAATNFLQLTDTPDEYTGQAAKAVRVNVTEDGLEFGDVASTGGGQWINVVDYGAVADLMTLEDITMTSGTAVVSSASYEFTEDDVGKYVVIRAASGATDGISPLHGTIVSVSGGDATLSQATSSFPAGAHTPRMDFGTDNVVAFRTAIMALPAGGTVFIPAGRYFIGATKYDGVTHFHTVGFPWNGLFQDQYPETAAGGTLRGDGMRTTRLFYSSSFQPSVGVQSGAGILVGLTPAGGYTGVTLSDFSITDLNDFATGNNAITVWGVDNFRMERVEIINAKGNGGFNYQGVSPHPSSPGAGAYGVNVWIRDCIIRGEADAGYISGDGVNIGNVRNLHFTGNTIKGVLRHGFEGGGSCYNQFIENNYIDMDNLGLSGINPTGGSNTTVANNIVLNVVSGATAIDFTTDVGGGFSITEEIVTGNYITGGQFAIKFQNTGGVGSGVVDKYIVSNNRIEDCDQAVHAPACDIMIHNNRITQVGGYVLYKAGGATAPDTADQLIDIRGNVVSADQILYNHGQYEGFDDAYQIKIEGNTIGGTMAEAAAFPSYGNLAQRYSPTGGSLAAGGILSVTDQLVSTATGGARVNDSVEVIPSGAWPKNLVYYGAVTAAETVGIWVYNPTSGSVAYPASDIIYYALHRK